MNRNGPWIKPDLLNGWTGSLLWRVGDYGIQFRGNLDEPKEEAKDKPVMKFNEIYKHYFDGPMSSTLDGIQGKRQWIVRSRIDEGGYLYVEMADVPRSPQELLRDEPADEWPVVSAVFGQGSYGKECEVCKATDWNGKLIHKPGCAEAAELVRAVRERREIAR